MLEKPDVGDETIADCLHHEFGLPVVQGSFLSPGADTNTAVYLVVADDQAAYFSSGFGVLSLQTHR